MSKENEVLEVETNDGKIVATKRGEDLAWDVKNPWGGDIIHYGDKQSLKARIRAIRAAKESKPKANEGDDAGKPKGKSKAKKKK